MSLFKGNREINELYIGNKEIAKIYHGSDLIFENQKYTPGQVVHLTETQGQQSFSVLDSGYYQISAIGGGGGGGWYLNLVVIAIYYCASGGSGGGFQGVYKLRKNVNYEYYAGRTGLGNKNYFIDSPENGENTTFRTITAYGGTAGYGQTSPRAGVGGAAGTFNPSDSLLVEPIWSRAGNNGGTRSANDSVGGAASIYGGLGPGSGSKYTSKCGGIEVIYLGKNYNKISRILTITTNVPAYIVINNVLVAQDVTTYDVSPIVYKQTISYEISADNYVTQSGTYTWTSANTTDTLNITLEEDI